MDIRLKRGRSLERRVLLERQTCVFFVLWHPYERKEESPVGGTPLDASQALTNPSHSSRKGNARLGIPLRAGLVRYHHWGGEVAWPRLPVGTEPDNRLAA